MYWNVTHSADNRDSRTDPSMDGGNGASQPQTIDSSAGGVHSSQPRSIEASGGAAVKAKGDRGVQASKPKAKDNGAIGFMIDWFLVVTSTTVYVINNLFMIPLNKA